MIFVYSTFERTYFTVPLGDVTKSILIPFVFSSLLVLMTFHLSV